MSYCRSFEEHSMEVKDAIEEREAEILALIWDEYTNASLANDDSKPKSYQASFFSGYLAALETIKSKIEGRI